MNIDEVIGSMGRESIVGIEKDEEDERDTEFDSVSKTLGEVCFAGNRI